MIIDKYRCIYTNVPKTGSQSVKKFFSIEETHFPLYKEQEKDETKFNDYYKFAFVRNPWDRLVSVFSYLKKGGGNSNDAKARDQYLAPYDYNFHDFVMALTPENIQDQVHLIPQYYWVCEKDGTQVLADFIGYFENYDDDWSKLHTKLNLDDRVEPFFNIYKNKLKNTTIYKSLYKVKWAKDMVHKMNMSKTVNNIGIKTNELPHVNKSKHKHYTEYYDEETKNHVAKLYKVDIELFDYKF